SALTPESLLCSDSQQPPRQRCDHVRPGALRLLDQRLAGEQRLQPLVPLAVLLVEAQQALVAGEVAEIRTARATADGSGDRGGLGGTGASPPLTGEREFISRERRRADGGSHG